MNPAVITAIAGIAGSLLGRRSNPTAPWTRMYQQYAPGYLGAQQEAFDWLTGPEAVRLNTAQMVEGTQHAARNAADQAMYYNAQRGGAGQGDLAANLSYARGRDILGYRQAANQQRYQNMFNLPAQALSSIQGTAQGGAALGQQQAAFDQSQNAWMQFLPLLAQAFSKKKTAA